MRPWIIWTLLISLPLCGVDSDFVFWNAYFLHHEVSEQLHGQLHVQYRMDRDASHVQFFYGQYNLLYRVCEAFELGPGYRQSSLGTNDRDLPRIQLYEPMFESHTHTSVAEWRLDTRERIQFAAFQPAIVSPIWVVRFRVELTGPRWPAGLPLRLTMSEEIFYRLFERFTQSRSRLGFILEASEMLHIHLFYLDRLLLGRRERGVGLFIHFRL